MLSRHRFLGLVAILALSWGFGPAAARADAASGDAARYVERVISEAMATMRSASLTEPQRAERLNALLQANFDIPRITQNVLGRYWTLASADERSSFGALFARWVVKTYSFGLREISGETVKVLGASRDGADGAMVTSNIVAHSGSATPVAWRLYGPPGKLRIVDIEVDGVSLARAQREEFASVIQHGGGTVGALNKELEARLRVDSAAAAQ